MKDHLLKKLLTQVNVVDYNVEGNDTGESTKVDVSGIRIDVSI